MPESQESFGAGHDNGCREVKVSQPGALWTPVVTELTCSNGHLYCPCCKAVLPSRETWCCGKRIEVMVALKIVTDDELANFRLWPFDLVEAG